MSLPKIVFTDIDGVWTDGGMYYDQTGNEWKKFNTSDSAGVLFCKKLHIPVVIITGENTEILAKRAQKLKIEHVYQGVSDKLRVATEVCKDMGVELMDTAFIGDDLGDMKLLQEVGFSAAPANASFYVKNLAKYVCEKKGGEGAFREFVEEMIAKEMNLNEFIDSVI